MTRVDMSPSAVSRRLAMVDELREVCLALAGPRLKRPWGVPDPGKKSDEVKESRPEYKREDKPSEPPFASRKSV